MNVTLVDSMGTDLSVVNAARVSLQPPKKIIGDIMFPCQGIYELKKVILS